MVELGIRHELNRAWASVAVFMPPFMFLLHIYAIIYAPQNDRFTIRRPIYSSAMHDGEALWHCKRIWAAELYQLRPL